MKLQIFGDYVFEFLLVTVLMMVSVVLIIPSIPMLVGITGYFKTDIHERKYRDIFIYIKENWKILIPYTIFQLFMILFPALNIYYFNTHIENINQFIYFLSYVVLILGVIYLVSAPTIIINMNTNFRELIFNGFVLLFGKIKNSLYALLFMALFIALILYFPYIVIFMFYFMILFISILMNENFLFLKAKALNISVEELKKKPSDDDYIEEIRNK